MLLPEGVRIGERAMCPSLGNLGGVAPDSEACHVSTSGSPDGVAPDSEACHVSTSGDRSLQAAWVLARFEVQYGNLTHARFLEVMGLNQLKLKLPMN